MRLPPTDIIASAEHPRPRGYIARWKPVPATERLLQDVQTVLDELADILPVTARQVFYPLVATDQIGKTGRDADRLNEHLQKARRAGRIPWDAIRDDGTSRARPFVFADEADAYSYVNAVARQARIDPMVLQPIRQWVICEAAGMVPQLARVADRYGIEVISGGGFNSTTEKRALGLQMARKPSLVWHVGDYDPSGVHVFQSLAEDVTAFVTAEGGEVAFKRLAVTPDQIAAYDLPSAPTKESDARAFEGTGTVQAEAVPPRVLAAALDDAIREWLDHDLLAEAETRTEALREELAR